MPLRILHLEHDSRDAELVETLLEADGIEPKVKRVATRGEFLAALRPEEYDLILSAHSLPDLDGLSALSAARKALPGIPFIFVSGKIGEEVAIDCLKRGATDYVLKSRLAKLGPCVRRALRETEETKARLRAEMELHDALLRMQATFENAAVGMAHVAPDGTWLKVNQRLCDIVGYSEEELLTMTFSDITHPDDLEPDWSLLRRVLAGEFHHYKMAKRYIHKAGNIVWINLTVSLVRKSAGEPHYFIGVLEDISARKKTEDDLLQSEERFRLVNEELEQRVAERTWELVYANRELRDQMTERQRLERSVLQIAEHERRTLGQDLHDGLCQHLTGVACMTQALSERLRNKGMADEGAELAEITGCLSDAADQTRFIARGLHPVELDSEGLLSALCELAVQTSRRVPCQLRCADPVEVPDDAVALNLYRIAQEAVNNAVKHSRAKSIVIHLRMVHGYVVLEVRDDGQGLPTPKRRSFGMGIRLMNYRAGVIGGAFSIRCGSEGGTSVTCTVPLDGASPFAPEAHGGGEAAASVVA